MMFQSDLRVAPVNPETWLRKIGQSASKTGLPQHTPEGVRALEDGTWGLHQLPGLFMFVRMKRAEGGYQFSNGAPISLTKVMAFGAKVSEPDFHINQASQTEGLMDFHKGVRVPDFKVNIEYVN